MAAIDESGDRELPVGPRDHAQGPATAPLTLVEYGDYECPHCGRAYPIVKTVQEHFGQQLRFVFRNFPITTVHPHAQHAAEAAEAAAVQRHFWEMHDTLFEHQAALDDRHLGQYADSVGLDRARFDRELKDGTHAHRVREDFMSGVRSGVNGTPTFFINGRRYDDSWDAATLIEALQAALKQPS
jgi:protein-disulfide isomerase